MNKTLSAGSILGLLGILACGSSTSSTEDAMGPSGPDVAIDGSTVASDGGNAALSGDAATVGLDAGKAELPGALDAGRLPMDGGLDARTLEKAWVYKMTVTNDWQSDLALYNSGPSTVNPNHYYQAKIDYLEDSISSITFTTTYVGPESSWQKTGMAQSGQVTWTAPSPQIIRPNEKFSVNLTASHLNRDHANMSGIGSILAQVFYSDDKGVQTGDASNLKAADGTDFFASTSANAFASQAATVFGTFGAGSSEGQLMAIRVSASNGNIAVRRAYIYEWK